jgi:hypothetical protein
MYGDPIDMSGWKSDQIIRTIEQKWREMMSKLKEEPQRHRGHRGGLDVL